MTFCMCCHCCVCVTVCVLSNLPGREYCRNFRGPGFLAVVWFCSPPFSGSELSFSYFLCVAGRACWRKKGGGGGGRSQVIRPRESLVLYKSFNISASGGSLPPPPPQPHPSGRFPAAVSVNWEPGKYIYRKRNLFMGKTLYNIIWILFCRWMCRGLRGRPRSWGGCTPRSPSGRWRGGSYPPICPEVHYLLPAFKGIVSQHRIWAEQDVPMLIMYYIQCSMY
jgi:hypothetical protein